MSTPKTDPIIAEVRAVRDKHAAQFDYDVDAIFKDIQAKQTTSRRKYVRQPPKRFRQGRVRSA